MDRQRSNGHHIQRHQYSTLRDNTRQSFGYNFRYNVGLLLETPSPNEKYFGLGFPNPGVKGISSAQRALEA
jgi:hypothetical protein